MFSIIVLAILIIGFFSCFLYYVLMIDPANHSQQYTESLKEVFNEYCDRDPTPYEIELSEKFAEIFKDWPKKDLEELEAWLENNLKDQNKN